MFHTYSRSLLLPKLAYLCLGCWILFPQPVICEAKTVKVQSNLYDQDWEGSVSQDEIKTNKLWSQNESLSYLDWDFWKSVTALEIDALKCQSQFWDWDWKLLMVETETLKTTIFKAVL